MHCPELRKRVIAVEIDLVACANVALKSGRSGQRAAEYPARIRDCALAGIMQRAEIDRRPVAPAERRLLDQRAVIPGAAGLDAEPARDAGLQRGFNAAHPIVTPVEGRCEGDEAGRADTDLGIVPVFLIERAVP